MGVVVCHCDFCQKRSGNVFMVSAHFPEEQIVTISGETNCYNGLEVDGVGAATEGGINYHFCTTCGSTVFWDYLAPHNGQRTYSIAVGSFVDADFPIPQVEVQTQWRHHWVVPVPGAVQF